MRIENKAEKGRTEDWNLECLEKVTFGKFHAINSTLSSELNRMSKSLYVHLKFDIKNEYSAKM